MNWLIRLFGFIVGASLCILALALIYWIGYAIIDWLEPSRLRFRFPIAIILVPIVAPILSGIYGAIYAPIFFEKPDGEFWNTSPIIRAIAVFPVFWCLVVLGYVFVFEPFGHSISSREWALIGKIVCFPAIVIVVGYFLFSKLISGESNDKPQFSKRPNREDQTDIPLTARENNSENSSRAGWYLALSIILLIVGIWTVLILVAG